MSDQNYDLGWCRHRGRIYLTTAAPAMSSGRSGFASLATTDDATRYLRSMAGRKVAEARKLLAEAAELTNFADRLGAGVVPEDQATLAHYRERAEANTSNVSATMRAVEL